MPKAKKNKNYASYQEGGQPTQGMEVNPPKGFHWMMQDGQYFLMEGDQKHEGAMEKAVFPVVKMQ